MKILTINNKKGEIFADKNRKFDFVKFSKKEINELIKNAGIMLNANGIGFPPIKSA